MLIACSPDTPSWPQLLMQLSLTVSPVGWLTQLLLLYLCYYNMFQYQCKQNNTTHDITYLSVTLLSAVPTIADTATPRFTSHHM